MAQARTLFLDMDVHKETIAGAYVAQDHGAAVPFLGPLGTRQGDIDHLVRQLPSKATQLIFVSEAGPWGDWLDRSLTTQGYDGWVGAPSVIPHKPGDRVTTDRRDAVQLARLARSGDLTTVSVPQGEDAAIRALPRAREDARSACQDAQCRRKALVLSQDIRSTGRATGGLAHLRWLAEVVCPTPAQHIVLQAYVRAVPEPTARLQRLAQARREHVNAWCLHPVVEALHALRGVQLTVAVTLVADMGAWTRFEHPRERMKLMGLLPSASSSGAQRR